MTQERPDGVNVLIVDDDACTCGMLEIILRQADCRTETAHDGVEAWEMLDDDPARYHAILLDNMMPRLSGMELLTQIKSDERLRAIPVILQTAKAEREDVLKGLNAGAYYYLTKPLDPQVVIAVVKTATMEYLSHFELLKEIQSTAETLRFLRKGKFVFQTVEEGNQLAMFLAKSCPDPKRVVVGLSELLINAVEHGNLGLSYDEKSELAALDDWRDELKKRHVLPENAGKVVTVDFERTGEEIEFIIKDEGEGFDWRPYEEMSVERAFDSHGRGILIARTVSFDSVAYRGRGNEVAATVSLAGVPA